MCWLLYLNLRFSHAQRISQSRSLWPGQVLGLLEGFLQSKYLMSTEGWSGVFLPARHLPQRTTTWKHCKHFSYLSHGISLRNISVFMCKPQKYLLSHGLKIRHVVSEWETCSSPNQSMYLMHICRIDYELFFVVLYTNNNSLISI